MIIKSDEYHFNSIGCKRDDAKRFLQDEYKYGYAYIEDDFLKEFYSDIILEESFLYEKIGIVTDVYLYDLETFVFDKRKRVGVPADIIKVNTTASEEYTEYTIILDGVLHKALLSKEYNLFEVGDTVSVVFEKGAYFIL